MNAPTNGHEALKDFSILMSFAGVVFLLANIYNVWHQKKYREMEYELRNREHRLHIAELQKAGIIIPDLN